MPTFNQGIRTKAGDDLFSRVDSGQTKITYTKVVFSSLDLSDSSDDEIANMTDVEPQELATKPEVIDQSFKDTDNTPETEIRAIVSNKSLSSGMFIRTYGLYASDDSGNEILYGVSVDDHPSYLPAFTPNERPQQITYNWDTAISDTNNVNFTDTNNAYVTYTDLNSQSSNTSSLINSNASSVSASASQSTSTLSASAAYVIGSNAEQLSATNSSVSSNENNLQKQITSNKNNISANNNAIKNAFNQNSSDISNVENELFNQYRIVQNVGTDLNQTNYGLTIGWVQNLKNRPSDVDSDWHLYMEHSYRLFNNTFVQFLGVLDINKRYYRYWNPTISKWTEWQDQDSDLKNQYNEVLNVSDDFNHENNGKTAGWAINVQNRPSDVDSNWHLYSLDQYRLFNNTFIQELLIIDLAKHYTRYRDAGTKQWQQWKITNK